MDRNDPVFSVGIVGIGQRKRPVGCDPQGGASGAGVGSFHRGIFVSLVRGWQAYGGCGCYRTSQPVLSSAPGQDIPLFSERSSAGRFLKQQCVRQFFRSRLIVLNTASIQLIPANVAAIRAQLGATSPFDILPAVWITSLASAGMGLLAAWCMERLWKR